MGSTLPDISGRIKLVILFAFRNVFKLPDKPVQVEITDDCVFDGLNDANDCRILPEEEVGRTNPL